MVKCSIHDPGCLSCNCENGTLLGDHCCCNCPLDFFALTCNKLSFFAYHERKMGRINAVYCSGYLCHQSTCRAYIRQFPKETREGEKWLKNEVAKSEWLIDWCTIKHCGAAKTLLSLKFLFVLLFAEGPQAAGNAKNASKVNLAI